MDRRPATQKDIAEKLGIDNSTVSLALRNSKKISKATRERVQKVAHEMGYSFNVSAANLAKYRSDTPNAPITAALAWLNCWPDPDDLHRLKEFDLYWTGAKETAARMGYHLEEFLVGNGMTLQRFEKIIESRGIRGVLLPPHPSNLQVDFRNVNWEKFSVLRFGRTVGYPEAHMVTADQFGNMMRAYDEVSRRGYQRIGMINVRREYTWVNFDSGYLRAQEMRGIEDRIPIFYELPNDQKKNLSNFRDWMDRYQPDAIIAATSGVTRLMERAGYQLGTDIGLATMTVLDTSIDAGIYQNSKEIGRVAALGLISQIQDNDTGIPELFNQTLVSGVWVDGDSLPDRT